MKKNMITLLGALAIIFTGCVKDDGQINLAIGKNNNNTTNNGTNPNGNNNGNNPNGQFLNLTGSINTTSWTDKMQVRSIGATTTVMLQWTEIPSPNQEVLVEINLYDGATHQEKLMQTVSETCKANNGKWYLNTAHYKITSATPGWLVATVTPLTASGYQSVTLTADLYRG